jgi:hypothetical protein
VSALKLILTIQMNQRSKMKKYKIIEDKFKNTTYQICEMDERSKGDS